MQSKRFYLIKTNVHEIAWWRGVKKGGRKDLKHVLEEGKVFLGMKLDLFVHFLPESISISMTGQGLSLPTWFVESRKLFTFFFISAQCSYACAVFLGIGFVQLFFLFDTCLLKKVLHFKSILLYLSPLNKLDLEKQSSEESTHQLPHFPVLCTFIPP